MSPPLFRPVRFGIVGVGGYAQAALRTLQQCSVPHDDGRPALAQVVAVSTRDPSKHAEAVAQLAAAGVRLCRDIDEVLAQDIEAVWLPTPIHLHRRHSERALAAGKAVLCEKPAAGCVDDLAGMAAARDRAGLPLAIGFQDVYDTQTLPLKQALAEGLIGRLRSMSLWACWPRGDQYYGRNDWAGAIQRDGLWTMDSPASNALAHFINVALFFAGPTPETSATPVAVEAELYRARRIENYDTCSLRLHLPGGVPLLVIFTHACQQGTHPVLTIHGAKGRVHWGFAGDIRAESADGKLLRTFPRDDRKFRNIVYRFTRLLRGVPTPEIALATLEVARAHLVAVNGASEATPVHDIPEEVIYAGNCNSGPVRAVRGLEEVVKHCAAAGQMLHESGRLPWTRPAGRRDLAGYQHFAGPAGWRARPAAPAPAAR